MFGDVTQVLQTNRQISQAGKTVWNHTKRQTDRALDQPKRLLALLNGGAKDADDSDNDVEGAVLNTYRCGLFTFNEQCACLQECPSAGGMCGIC